MRFRINVHDTLEDANSNCKWYVIGEIDKLDGGLILEKMCDYTYIASDLGREFPVRYLPIDCRDKNIVVMNVCDTELEAENIIKYYMSDVLNSRTIYYKLYASRNTYKLLDKNTHIMDRYIKSRCPYFYTRDFHTCEYTRYMEIPHERTYPDISISGFTGDFIKSCRKKMGYSIKDVSSMSNIPEDILSKLESGEIKLDYENGESYINYEYVDRLCFWLAIPTDSF